jgi:hypothetical protein
MDPFAGLGLAHPKEAGLDLLNGVDLEIEEDKEQSIRNGGQPRLPPPTRFALAGRRPLLFLEHGFHFGKRWQQVHKGLKREPRQVPNHVGLVRQHVKPQHVNPPVSAVRPPPPILPHLGLFPVKSHILVVYYHDDQVARINLATHFH